MLNYPKLIVIVCSLGLSLTLNGQRVLRISDSALKIATSNMRSVVEDEKLENILKEIERMKLNIIGVSDTQWRESGNFIIRNGKQKIYYSSSNELRHRCGEI